jgi:UDP-N-acetylmuramyl pentapeptide synthase
MTSPQKRNTLNSHHPLSFPDPVRAPADTLSVPPDAAHPQVSEPKAATPWVSSVPTLGEKLLDHIAVFAGRAVSVALTVARPGGGTALPGMVTNHLSPGLLARVLAQPPEGIAVVTGSSGKSTTTQMLAAILREHGLTVFTNDRTANITKGIVSELLPRLDRHNRLQVDVVVLEIDEGYSALVTEQVPARVSVLLNVMVDQLHRWHEPERVAGYLARTAAATQQTVVVNADDPHLAAIGASLNNDRVRRFALANHFAGSVDQIGFAPRYDETPDSRSDESRDSRSDKADIVVVSVEGTEASLQVDGVPVQLHLPSDGAHIASDAAAAIEGARAMLGDRFDLQTTRRAFLGLRGVAGRNERVTIGDHAVDLVFTKSPTSMQVNLDLFDNSAKQVMVAIGKDIFDTSQLWLVDWGTLPDVAVVSGWQAWDIALRLAYDEVDVGKVEPDIRAATRDFLAGQNPAEGHSAVIYTPESMRQMRRSLKLIPTAGPQSESGDRS